MQLISKTKDNEKTIKFTVDEYEHLLKILDLCTPPEHRKLFICGYVRDA